MRMAVLDEGGQEGIWMSVTVEDMGIEVELEGAGVGIGLGRSMETEWLDVSRTSSSLSSFPGEFSCLGRNLRSDLVIHSNDRVPYHDVRGVLVPRSCGAASE